LKIAASYALAGVLWILLSDWLLQLFVADHRLLSRLSLFKGWAFIAATAVVLYRLISKEHGKIRRTVEIVREGEQLLRNVLETLPVGVWLLDRDGTITYGNPAGQKIWGGARFVEIEEFGDYQGWWLATGKRIEAQEWGGARAIREGQTALDEEIEIEGFDGRRRIILHSAVPLRNQQNELIGAVVVNEDITGRKELEKNLLEKERVYRELFEGNPQPMWVYAVETMEFLAVNDAAVNHYGYSRPEFLRMTLRDIRLPDDVPPLTASVEKARGKLAKVGLWQHRKKDSTLIDVEITTHDILFNGRAARLVLINDVTERKRVERENAAYLGKLRLMSQEMLLIEERERRQLAITLHDQIGQVLALAKIKLGALQAADSAEECRQSAGRIRELLEQAISSSRTLTFELSSPVLYELGFESAVQALCERFQQQHGLRIEFVTDREPKPLADDVRILLFRAIRELLVNIVKHAETNILQVSCRRSNHQISIVVADAGIGFEPQLSATPSPETGGFGLFSIRERLHLLGGEMTIAASPGHGTRVTLVAPLQEAKKEGVLS
jgi:PAS domain S-box-containing protein